MEEKMRYYERFRTPPKEAMKTIAGGRLKGFTDVNPMWRIKMLTECFGPAGEGWQIANVNFWSAPGAGGEVLAFCSLTLQTRQGDGWSAPIFGIGGSKLIAKEKDGLVSDDEGYKKAYTDAMSVACKALGMAADVYWDKDASKYDERPQEHRAHGDAQKSPPQSAPKSAKLQAPAVDVVQLTPLMMIDNFCSVHHIDRNTFFRLRQAVIDGGICSNIPSNQLTPADLDVLFNAIRVNCLEDAS